MAKLQLIFDGKIKQEYELNKVEMYIGRNPSNDIVIENRGVSGKHAVIISQGDEYLLKDLDSTNGTKLNGKKINTIKLQHGDHINLFKHTLNILLLSNELLDSNNSDVPSLSLNKDDPDATIMLDASQIEKTGLSYKSIKAKDNKQNVYNKPRLEVTSADESNTIILSKKPVLIGKKNSCHVHTGGWIFSPAISAVVKRDMSGMYTINPETTIKLNDKKIKSKQLLKNGDRILIRDTLIIFMV